MFFSGFFRSGSKKKREKYIFFSCLRIKSSIQGSCHKFPAVRGRRPQTGTIGWVNLKWRREENHYQCLVIPHSTLHTRHMDKRTIECVGTMEARAICIPAIHFSFSEAYSPVCGWDSHTLIHSLHLCPDSVWLNPRLLDVTSVEWISKRFTGANSQDSREYENSTTNGNHKHSLQRRI